MKKITFGFAAAALVGLASLSSPASAFPGAASMAAPASDATAVAFHGRRQVCSWRTVVTHKHGHRVETKVKVCK